MERMSSTEATASSSSESNGNGKRERSPSEHEGAPTKLLKSSDDSDNEGGGSSSDPTPEGESKESTDPDPSVDDEKEVPSSSKPENMETIRESSNAESTESNTTAPEQNLSGVDDDPKDAEDELIQIDRAGEDVVSEQNNPTQPPPLAAAPATVVADPRVSAASNSSNPRVITTNTSSDPRAATQQPAIPSGVPGVDPNAQATITNPDQLVEERGEVSALYVGRVIGKGGEMIRDLQARSGARIDVDQNVPAGQPRVITYRGTRQTVDFAKRLVQMLSTEGIHENDLPLGHASQEFLIIPAQAVGKVIGRGGEMIRELQSRSQAKIQIDHTGQSGIPTDQKQVTITGTHEAVVKAKEMVLLLVANPLMDAQQSLNMLIDDKVRRGNKWGSGPPYMNLPNQGINMQPHMVPPQFQAMSQGYGSYQPPQAHHGGGGGYPVQQQQQALPYGGPLPPGGPPGYPPHHPQAYAPPYGSADGRENDVFYAPKQFMGRIIGGKGVTVNDLQRRSGCDIQINQDVAPGQDCEISLKGTRQAIEMAKAMIQEIIDVGPQHPYAGGMDSYSGPASGGGGGGGYHGAYAQQQYPPYQQQQQQQGYEQAAYGQAAYMPQGGGYGQPPLQVMGGGYGHQQPQHSQYGGYLAPHQPVAPLPVSAWKAATAPDGQIYYYNERTGETQWDKPAGMP
jgi:far upstream element-binding protein